jgi:four helix bundle protein
MKYRRFEELPCWQDARELSKMVFELTRQEAFCRDFSFKDQIWRAAGSVMDNIAGGFDDSSSKGFVRFLGYAQRSTSEIQSQLYCALDCGYISQEQ